MKIRDKIKTVVDKSDTPSGRIFDLTVLLLIIISVISFMIETLPSISDKATRAILSIIEVLIVVLFTLELLLRIIVSEKQKNYIFSLYGVIDLLAVLPFYLSLGYDLRSLRLLRVMRLFRSFKIVRYNKALQRLRQALFIAKEEFVLFSIVSVSFHYC